MARSVSWRTREAEIRKNEAMQKRHTDRQRYFHELENTSREFYLHYLSSHQRLAAGMNVLEVGCGDGGNLVPFAQMGCRVTGMDIAQCRINDAQAYFSGISPDATFICCDFFKCQPPRQEADKYDVILLHDVIEHIPDKARFMLQLKAFLKSTGVLFVGFPAWQMPFGGHQQICRSAVCSHLPFIHLLPVALYKGVLRAFGEKDDIVNELLSIKRTRTSIETFERIVGECRFTVEDRVLWFVNPHYKQKFHMKPRRLWRWIYPIKYLRNFVTTSCWYLLK